MHWHYSGVGLKALGDAIRETGQYDAVMAKTAPETRDAFGRPSQVKWHDGAVVFDVTLALDAALGGDAVERVYYEHVRRSIGPLMMPFVKIVLMLAGKSPPAIFSRFDDLMSSMVRGVRSSWASTGPTGGVLTLKHEDELKPPSFRAWQGVMRYSFELCEVDGQMKPRLSDFNGHDLVWDMTWTNR